MAAPDPNPEEQACLRSQSATLKTGRGQHRKHRAYAFTERGAITAASVLSSPKAIEMGREPTPRAGETMGPPAPGRADKRHCYG